MNKFTKYSFDIPDDDYNYQKNLYVLTTKESLISKYGESEGKKGGNHIEKNNLIVILLNIKEKCMVGQKRTLIITIGQGLSH
jgi:hypothetical protein